MYETRLFENGGSSIIIWQADRSGPSRGSHLQTSVLVHEAWSGAWDSVPCRSDRKWQAQRERAPSLWLLKNKSSPFPSTAITYHNRSISIFTRLSFPFQRVNLWLYPQVHELSLYLEDTIPSHMPNSINIGDGSICLSQVLTHPVGWHCHIAQTHWYLCHLGSSISRADPLF